MEANGNSEAVQVLSAEQGREVLERQAQRYFRMTGPEFAKRWNAGEFRDENEYPYAMRVAMLIPFGG